MRSVNGKNRQQIMNDYRNLTPEEITALEANGCRAEDWDYVETAYGFVAGHYRNVAFHGHVRLGSVEGEVEVSQGFRKSQGIYNATLRNVTIGDNCLIENIGNHINEYTIGNDCIIAGTGRIETTGGATFGEGNVISVLNEAGDGNLIIYSGLTAQFAAFMVSHCGDRATRDILRRLINEEMEYSGYDRGTIGNNVKIVNTADITNTVVQDECEINGAARISDCTIVSSEDSSVYIGTGVICENTIITDGSSVVDGARLRDCFVGEACTISGGFSASSSVFFANSHLANGEACAAFCGPFTVSHHKSSLLIGGMFSFYNAGSATNFSNHAYKMGPMHYGCLGRGTKTASGAHIIMPAEIGPFSMCMGRIANHPDTRDLPFSYIFGDGRGTHILPGRNLMTTGLYRDIRKWKCRDKRSEAAKKSTVNTDWLNPFTVTGIIRGKRLLESLGKNMETEDETYSLGNCTISQTAIHKGIRLYDMALRLYMGMAISHTGTDNCLEAPETSDGTCEWNDLAGLLLPSSEEQRIADDIRNGDMESVQDIADRFARIHNHYAEWQWSWAYKMITGYYGTDVISAHDRMRIMKDYEEARDEWAEGIMADAGKEFRMGDVDEEVYENFINQLKEDMQHNSLQ